MVNMASLDRICDDIGYEPGNVRFVDIRINTPAKIPTSKSVFIWCNNTPTRDCPGHICWFVIRCGFRNHITNPVIVDIISHPNPTMLKDIPIGNVMRITGNVGK